MEGKQNLSKLLGFPEKLGLRAGYLLLPSEAYTICPIYDSGSDCNNLLTNRIQLLLNPRLAIPQ
jgi:hypothetical protein